MDVARLILLELLDGENQDVLPAVEFLVIADHKVVGKEVLPQDRRETQGLVAGADEVLERQGSPRKMNSR